MPQRQFRLEPPPRRQKIVPPEVPFITRSPDSNARAGEPAETLPRRDAGPPGNRARRSPRQRFVRILTLGLILAAGAVLVWNQVLKDRFVPKRLGTVVPGAIYRSGQISKWLIEETLIERDIRVIVDFQNFDWYDKHQQAELAVAWKYRIPVNRFVLTGDGTGDVLNYAQAIAIMEDCRRKGTPVLVHCGAGSQRTGAVVAFYRLLVQKRPPREAYDELLAYDWNPRKDAVLLDYMNRHMAELARLLVEFGVLDRVPDDLPVIGPGH